MKASPLSGMNRFKYLLYKNLRNFSNAPPKLDQSLMGLRKEHSVFLFNERFLIESRYRAGYPLYEGFFKPDNMGEALILLMSSK